MNRTDITHHNNSRPQRKDSKNECTTEMSSSTTMPNTTGVNLLRKPRHAKKVGFVPYTRIRRHPPRSAYGPNDMQNCWFSRNEILDIKVERNIVGAALTRRRWRNNPRHPNHKRAVQQEMDGIDDILTTESSRGVLDKDNLEFQKWNIVTVRRLVCHQFRLRRDSELTAHIYRQCSLSSVNKARAMALEDEKEAFAIHSEDIDASNGAVDNSSCIVQASRKRVAPTAEQLELSTPFDDSDIRLVLPARKHVKTGFKIAMHT